MIYREYLVMRKALAWFAGVVLALMLVIPVTLFNNSIGYAEITNGAAWLAAIFASIFGVALGNGSREASRVLWVLPAPRWKLALQVIAVDLAGATVAFACVCVFFPAVAALRFRLNLSGTVGATDITVALAMIYGAYGWSALIGMIGRRVAYCGLVALPALMLWMILAQAQSPVSTILRGPLIANPFAVYNAGLLAVSNAGLDAWPSLQWVGAAWITPILVAIAIATCGLAVALWQRAEAIT
jgi:hypothetical protein